MRRSRSRDILEGEDMNGAPAGHQESASPDTMDTGEVPEEAGSGNTQLHKKLRELLKTRTEIDKNIEAIKRVLDIVDDS